MKQAAPSLETGERGTPVKSPLAAEPVAEAESSVNPKPGFPIGEPGGGMEAFEALFSNMHLRITCSFTPDPGDAAAQAAIGP